MDYLSRRAGLSIDTIETAYEKKRKTDIIIASLSILMLLVAFFTAFSDSRKKSIVIIGNKVHKTGHGWHRQIAIFIVYSLLYGGLLTGLYYLLLFTVNGGYQHMNQMLNLSG